jgi:ATP-binding cassette subfamily B protein
MLRQFAQFYRPHLGLVGLDFGCAALSGMLELGFPMAVRAFIDHLLPQQDMQLIVLAVLGLLSVYLLNAGLMAVVTYWGHVLGIAIETELRRHAFDHLMRLSHRFYDNQKTGHLVGRVTKNLEDIGEVAHHGPEDLLIAVLTFLGAFALMLFVNLELALLTLLVVPAAAFVIARYGGRMTANWQAQFGRVGASTRGSRRRSAASAWSRPSPTRRRRGASSPLTMTATAASSSMPTGSWRPASRSTTSGCAPCRWW